MKNKEKGSNAHVSNMKLCTIEQDFETIMNYAHFFHWLPDWEIAAEIYRNCPDSYSVLAPFAYSYLEELIRSTTSDYGLSLPDKNGWMPRHSVGRRLYDLAVSENQDRYPEYVEILESNIKKYFSRSSNHDRGDNRNSVVHGYSHPINWDRRSFEKLIHDIASVSKYSGF